MKFRIAPLVLLMLLVSACSAPQEESDVIKLGYIGPLTGEAASYGVDTLNGVQMKVDEINDAGGIGGKMVEVIAEDGRCTAADAASAAQKLVHVDKVHAIIGGQCSGETLAAAPIADAAGVVMMSALSSSPDVTDAGDFVFRDYPSDALKTTATAQYLKEKGLPRLAIISENTDFCTAFRDAMVANLGEENIVFNETVEPGTKDFRSLLTRLEGLEFDAFMPNGQSPAAVVAMMQQLREQGYEQLAISHDVAQDASTARLGGEAVAGLQAVGVPAVDPASDFATEFIAQHGEPQGAFAFAAHAYDAAGVVLAGVQESGTGEDLRDYLYNLEGFDGVVGMFSFDDNGDVQGIPYVLYEVQGGEWVAGQDIVVE